jgi:hypothetical protein
MDIADYIVKGAQKELPLYPHQSWKNGSQSA